MSSTVTDSGRFTVFEIAPEMNGCAAAIIFMWPIAEIARSPTATSNTGRCSSFRPGAPTIEPVVHQVRLDLARSPTPSSRASRAPAPTVWLTIVICPPPTSSLNFTREKSGSMPVVSQSIRNEIVPVGASTVACAFR